MILTGSGLFKCTSVDVKSIYQGKRGFHSKSTRLDCLRLAKIILPELQYVRDMNNDGK
jgi:hypothetical protein